jgi:uncharacterized protein YgiM (DUF1202 family)
MSQRGAISLPVIIAAVLGLGFAASVYLNIAQHQRADQDRKLLQGEIVDLRYQIGQDKLATNATPVPSPEATPDATPEPSPSGTPAVLGASTTKTLKTKGNVHSDASVSSSIVIHLLPAGTTVTLGTDVRNGYQQITVNGVTGYILASFLQ